MANVRWTPVAVPALAQREIQKRKNTLEVRFAGTAKIAHRTTGREFEISADDLDWQQVAGDERQMVTEYHYEAELDHPELGPLSWALWEYPVGMENHRETDANGHRVITDFDFGLEHSPEAD